MIRELVGIDLGPDRANALALATLSAAAVISILLNRMSAWESYGTWQ
jgi:hypothetical protein